MGLWLFTLTSTFGIMVGAFADGAPMTNTGYDGAIAFAPGIIACLTLFVGRMPFPNSADYGISSPSASTQEFTMAPGEKV